MENKTGVQHKSIPVQTDFENFTYNLETLLGVLYPEIMGGTTEDITSIVGYLESLGGDNELILFSIIEHGELLRIKGYSAKAKQYQIGNPVIALKMTQLDVRAGLYAPLRILVYENKKGIVSVEYDLPSSQFGQFNDEKITAIAQTLDQKVFNLIKKADTGIFIENSI
jgi:uncharacterized protein (DUF302 family)